VQFDVDVPNGTATLEVNADYDESATLEAITGIPGKNFGASVKA